MTPSGVLKLYVHNLLKQLDTKIAIDSLIFSEVMMFTKVLHVHACSCMFMRVLSSEIDNVRIFGRKPSKQERILWEKMEWSDMFWHLNLQILKSDPFWFILNMFDLFERQPLLRVLPCAARLGMPLCPTSVTADPSRTGLCTILYNIVQLLIMYNCFSQCMSIFASFVHFVQQFTGIWHNLTDFCGKTLCSQARSFAESICQDSFVPQGPEASDLSRPSMSEDVRIYQKPLSIWDSSEHICAFDWSLASGQSILPGQHVCPRCKDVQTFRFCALHCSIVESGRKM